MEVNVVKTPCVEVNRLGKEGFNKMLSILGQMREGSEMRQSLSIHRKENMREFVTYLS
jgi:hypothetical protein